MVWTPREIGVTAPSVRVMGVADLDRDADADVLVSVTPAEVGWWENPGPSGPWVFHSVSVRETANLLGADLDGDGDGDLVGSVRDPREVVW